MAIAKIYIEEYIDERVYSTRWTPMFKNFLDYFDDFSGIYEGVGDIPIKDINLYLIKEYKASLRDRFGTADRSYIIFSSNEDALLFKLRYS